VPSESDEAIQMLNHTSMAAIAMYAATIEDTAPIHSGQPMLLKKSTYTEVDTAPIFNSSPLSAFESPAAPGALSTAVCVDGALAFSPALSSAKTCFEMSVANTLSGAAMSSG
jgi:hypothetical protein